MAAKEDNLLAAKGVLLQKNSQDPERRVDLVYPEQRYAAHYPPLSIYIPTDEVMFALMKACVGADQPQDLWIFDDSDQILALDSRRSV
jgi:hypothetical protein